MFDYELFSEEVDLLEAVELHQVLNEGLLSKIRELIGGKNKSKDNKKSNTDSKQSKPKSNENTPYKRKEVSSKSDMDKFYKGNDFTLEGIQCDEASCQMIANYLARNFDVNTPIEIYVIKGKDMNKVYDLYGDNAYPNDLHIMVIPLKSLKKSSDIVDAKYSIKARYFNDVVDNNEYREYLAGRHEKSEQIQWIIDAYNRK